jgi:formylglycine-generating enzyme required for sulfatase activity
MFMFRKNVLLLSGILCVSFSAGLTADSYTELLESARATRKSASALVDSVNARLDARDAALTAKAVAVDSVAAHTAAAKAAVKHHVAADTAATKVTVKHPVAVDTTVAKVAVKDSVAVDTIAAKVAVTDSSAVDTAAVEPARKAETPVPAPPKIYTDSAAFDSAAAAPVRKAEKPVPAPPRIHPVGKPEIEMVLVKGGKFNMGCPGNDGGCISDERPRHEVKLGDFYIGKYPVTQKQWALVMGINPSHFEGDDWAVLPVEQVSWNEIQEFIKRLNVATGKKYRLPTEAEWEYAARGGASGKGEKFSGHQFLDDVAWYDYNSYGRTQPVGTKQPNEIGLHDMIGNVWEWVGDWYDKNYYRESQIGNPKGPRRGTVRVYRGCSFNSAEGHCRSSVRNFNKPDHREIYVGFRLAHPQ